MEKIYEFRELIGTPGCYKAVIYNRLGGYYKEIEFLNYSKKEIYKKLRNDYHCIIRRCRA